MIIDKEEKILWKFILETKQQDRLWELSVAVHKILKKIQFLETEIRKRQDTIYKLRKELKDTRKSLKE